MSPSPIRLGLIGDNIAASSSPALHRLAGQLSGLTVTYDLLRPADLNRSFEEVLAWAESSGYRGLNITYPYKERVVAHLDVPDPAVRAVGACNTVLFGAGRPVGWNTDYSGFMAAYRHRFGDKPPGRVAMAGTGGVGRAIAVERIIQAIARNLGRGPIKPPVHPTVGTDRDDFTGFDFADIFPD